MVWWLRLHASNAGGTGSILGQGTKIPCTVQFSQKGFLKKTLLLISRRTTSCGSHRVGLRPVYRASSLPVSQVPYDDLRYLFGEIMYGGHITDDWDRRLCRTYLEEFIKPEMLEGELALAPGFPLPGNMDYSAYHQVGPWVSLLRSPGGLETPGQGQGRKAERAELMERGSQPAQFEGFYRISSLQLMTKLNFQRSFYS